MLGIGDGSSLFAKTITFSPEEARSFGFWLIRLANKVRKMRDTAEKQAASVRVDEIARRK